MVHDESVDDGYGAESYVRRLVAGLEAAGDTVELVAGQRRHRGATKLLDIWDPWSRRLVGRRVVGFRPEVIHFHNVIRELSGSVLGAAPAVPAVMTVHDKRILGAREHRLISPPGISERVGVAVVTRAARRRLAATIGVSEPVSAALRAAGFPAVTTVPVPVAEPTAPLIPAAECRDIAVVSRLAADKGVDVVLDAFAGIGSAAAGSRLLIAGDGPARDSLQRRARPLGGAVEFLGRLDEPDVSALLGRVRVVVVASVPSRRPEGSSLTVAEAAAHGRPVIGSDDPAVRDVVERIDAGSIVPAGDAAALAEALRRYLGDDELVRETVRRSAGGVAAYRSESVAAATRTVYRRAMEPRRDG